MTNLSVKQKQEFNIDLENWMSGLPPLLKNIPIIYLAIPGSHDSMTFNLTRKSSIAPDAVSIVQKLRIFRPIVSFIMSRWSKTQNLNTVEQLKAGIRYFDLRVATRIGTNDFYFVHGLYAGKIVSELMKINMFLSEHLEEVVILDFQHFYSMNESDHERLMALISSIFGEKLAPYSPYMEQLSLIYLTENNNYQVIVIYRSNAAKSNQPKLWPSLCFPTPWPDTLNPEILIEKLNKGLNDRSPKNGYVSQFLLTPTTWFVIKRLTGSLKSNCVLPLTKYKYPWIKNQIPGPCGVNIIISDFVEMHDCQFSEEVVKLNLKLLHKEAFVN